MSDHSGSSSNQPGSLKHRILSRPASKNQVDPSNGSRSDGSGNTTPVPSPAGSHTSELQSPLKKRLRTANDNSSDSSSLSSATTNLSVSNHTTPSPSPNLRGSPLGAPVVTAQCPPSQFNRGSLIQLANGELKTVEQMSAEDFIRSASMSPGVQVEKSEIVRIERIYGEGSNGVGNAVLYFRVGNRLGEIAVEASMDHPFFVLEKGWCSVCPPGTFSKYGLPVRELLAGDICVSLSNGTPQREIHSNGHSHQSGMIRDNENGSNGLPHAMMNGHANADHLASFRRWSAPEDDRFLESL